MMNRRIFTSAAALFALTACSSEFRVYTGPAVTNNQVLEQYDFELGFAPTGHKEVEGDGRTPEGAYFIDRKNPNSSFYLSIGISYPNAADRARARAMGKSPGGDIFIHGTPRASLNRDDWTAGCLAVKDREMEDIYAMVNVGTPIFMYA
jgi:murein L,D-transpeptidase YafK